LIKLGDDASNLWSKHFGGPESDQGIGVAYDVYGRAFVTGYFRTGCGRIRPMRRALAIIASLVVTGCNASSSSHDGGDAGDDGAACVPHDDVYDCLDASWPVCPATAQPEQPCDYSVPPCMGCTNGGATVGSGYTCVCQDAGLVPNQDAALWGCVGTEYTCR
jgi:hypothetical protein